MNEFEKRDLVPASELLAPAGSSENMIAMIANRLRIFWNVCLFFKAIVLVGMVFLCAGIAWSDETKGLCPDPKIQYTTYSSEQFWKAFAETHLFEIKPGRKVFCAVYRILTVDQGYYTKNIMITSDEFHQRAGKLKGLVDGFDRSFRMIDEWTEASNNDKEVRKVILKEYFEKDRQRMELITGLTFKGPEEWFEWWKTNKNNLVLSKNGRYLVVREK